MDFDSALKAGQFAFTALVGLYSLLAARRASSKAEAEQLVRRLADQDNRILVLEQRMDHLPDGQQLSELAGDIKAMNARLEGLGNQIGPLARSVERMNDYLMTHK
ncbi:DUF2730 domain-containing protein [Pseudomonas paralcaligenes]|uniref:DUF2730 domain-containing protein n=1 Tax=Pseudomonas paralcaligenes TaxID=2772558 RepID=UPI0021CEC0A4|nr:DUF2730 domain-containing protein [Pseudomonas paralcaligenes]